ncbi:DUF922 domain-containing protein [Gracilimonas sp. BCB1]|uniref:DUF922 domain-containing protein n=1 Tax=Gracilimonas sp. BCB1 TaxID=3152362 RepID=UPI0032D8BF8A
MKAILSILILLFSSGLILGQHEPEKDYIYWSEDYKLVWTDFEEIPKRYSEHAAFSVVGYESSFNMNGQEYEAEIKTYFSKNESWSKSWIASLLLHEQGHFDLAEVNARRFRKRVKEAMKAGTISVSVFEEMSDEAMAQLEKVQSEYDEATNYSMDYRSQLQWSEQIKEQLKELEAFASPQVLVTRKAN